jgi:hypothetical protein
MTLIMSLLQDLIPQVISGQKCHTNIGEILYGYGDMCIRNVASLGNYFYLFIYLFIYLLEKDCTIQFIVQFGKKNCIFTLLNVQNGNCQLGCAS